MSAFRGPRPERAGPGARRLSGPPGAVGRALTSPGDNVAERARPLWPAAGGIGAAVMPARTPRATPVRADNLALLHVLEATIEILKTENEILQRRLGTT